MKPRFLRWLPWLAPLVVVALLAAGAVRAVQVPRVRLPDGSVWNLEAITTGETHEFAYFEGWRKLVRPVLGPGVPSQRIFRSRFSSRSSVPIPRNRMTLWLVVEGVPADSARFGFLIVDEEGNETASPGLIHEDAHFAWRMSRRQPRFYQVVEVALLQLPRRGRRFRLCFYDRRTKRRIGGFSVPNPTPGPHPDWVGKPVPVSRRVGDLTVTLKELTAHIAQEEGHRRIGRALARFSVTHEGRQPRQWSVGGFAFAEDATGNWVWGDTGQDTNTGEAFAHFWRGIWPDASPWKIRIPLAHTADATFTPEETWRVRALPVPGPRSATRCTASTLRLGSRLELLGIWGVHSRNWAAGVPGVTPEPLPQPLVRVRWRVIPDGWWMALRVVDDRGRHYTQDCSSYLRLGDPFNPRVPQIGAREKMEYHFGLDLPRDTRRVQLQVILHKSRYVEFLAHPRWVEPTKRAP